MFKEGDLIRGELVGISTYRSNEITVDIDGEPQKFKMFSLDEWDRLYDYMSSSTITLRVVAADERGVWVRF